MSQNNNLSNAFRTMSLADTAYAPASAVASSSKKKKSMKKKSIKTMNVHSANDLASLFETRFNPYGKASAKRASTRKVKMNTEPMPSVHRMKTRSRNNASLLPGLQDQRRTRAVQMAVEAANQAQVVAAAAANQAQEAAAVAAQAAQMVAANVPIQFDDTFAHTHHALSAAYPPHMTGHHGKYTRRHKKHGRHH